MALEATHHQQEVELISDRKTIEQLKSAVKNSKQEISLLQERLEKEQNRVNSKTDEFLAIIDRVNCEMRKIHSYYQEKSMAKELEKMKAQTEQLTKTDEIRMHEIALLKSELKQAKVSTLEIATAAGETNLLATINCTTSTPTASTNEAEIDTLKQHLKEKEEELAKVTQEFGQLDEYTTRLGGQCERLQLRITSTLPALCTPCNEKLQKTLAMSLDDA